MCRGVTDSGSINWSRTKRQGGGPESFRGAGVITKMGSLKENRGCAGGAGGGWR